MFKIGGDKRIKNVSSRYEESPRPNPKQATAAPDWIVVDISLVNQWKDALTEKKPNRAQFPPRPGYGKLFRGIFHGGILPRF
jgi:hypothetical protein